MTVVGARADGGVPGDPSGIENVIRRARWLTAVLCAIQFALYVPPDGVTVPYSKWWGALPVTVLVLVNVEAVRRLVRGTANRPGWALAQVVCDAAVVALLIGMFAFDPTSALWTLLVIPSLEAAVRGWSRGILLVFGILVVYYVVQQTASAFVFDVRGHTVDAVTYRLGILGIIATALAALARRLTTQLAVTAAAQAEADQLRGLAVATRRMSSLDVPTVAREVTVAAESFGFSGVHLRARDGGVLAGHSDAAATWPPTSPDWFDAVAAAARDSDYLVLAARDAPGLVLDPDTSVVAAAVTAGPTVEALLLGRHPTPVEQRHAEGFALLAAQTSAALGNALRFEESRAYEQRLAHQATHDSLTGLPNRSVLRGRAHTAVERSRDAGTLAGVLYVDLDRFKEVNDVLGHATGDRLLQQVARRLVGRLRPEDTCARVGGDEFVVVTGGHVDVRALLRLADQVRDAVTEPFVVDGVELDVEASLGVAWAPDHGVDVDLLLRRADVAMYAAKTRREGVVVYDPADDRLTAVHLTTLGDLRRALDATGQLEPHFQPIVELTGAASASGPGAAFGRLAAVEALVRWHHPIRGTVQPDAFIPVAEGTSVIHQVTDRVLTLALDSLRTWTRHGLRVDLAVNISARALLDSSFSRRLSAMIESSGATPANLRLEITESTLLVDPTRAVVTMNRLRDLGVRLSIDDFGTGYSSMSYLKRLPLDEIKIDRSFVVDMTRSARDAAVVQSVVDLGHSLGLRVVAEGVEDDAVLDALAGTGCDMAQGFHIGRPMTAPDLLTWAEQRHVVPRQGAPGEAASAHTAAAHPTSVQTTSVQSTSTKTGLA